MGAPSANGHVVGHVTGHVTGRVIDARRGAGRVIDLWRFQSLSRDPSCKSRARVTSHESA